MNADLEKLITLEQVDREIGRLSAEVAALPKRVAEIEHQLADAKDKVEQAKHAIKSQEQKRRGFDSDVQAYQQKIAKFRDQSLDVKTNDQYRALMHEIEFSQTEIRKAEDKILEIMEGSELLDRQVKASEGELRVQSAQVEKEKEEARALTAKDEETLKSLQSDRDRLRGGISSDALDLYDRVVRARKTAIAEAREQRCTACFVLMRPQKWNDIKTAVDLLTCDSCGRILFYDPTHEPPPPPVPEKKKSRKAKSAVSESEIPESEPAPPSGNVELAADHPV
ncbi:MAG TPA: C4-type zinc ribbon domain-containing protein [Terriglobales bacterium]|nr:C4-type zinc ribbon domain-containing protein [Terriglobales bacterium]